MLRRFNTGEFADVWPSITNDPALRDITQPVPEREQLTFRSLRIVICSVLPLLPLIAGLSHTLLDVGGFGIGVACLQWRPAPVLWLLGLLFRRAADSIALSLAVSAVWKCHFYDQKTTSEDATRPAQTTPDASAEMFWSGSVCRLVAFIASPLEKGERLDVVPGRCGARVRPDEVDPEGRLARRLRDVREVGDCRSGRGGRLPALAGFMSIKARRLFMLLPGRRKRQGAPRIGEGRREAVRHDGLGSWERGALAVCGRRAFGGGARPHWLVAVVAYPGLGAWAAFTAFVKFAFVVFALNTLAGFGTLPTRRAGSSGKVRSCASRTSSSS